MQLLNKAHEAQEFIALQRQKGHSCGFVPTMGALHNGHLSLLSRAHEDNDISVCSVYVNPTQFNNSQDLEKYPRDLQRDIQILEDAGCDALFCPADEEMYPGRKEQSLQIDFGPMSRVLEGEFRPGHFSGVGLVLSKLFHIIPADRAYFGQKDLQQCSIVNKLISDLFFNIELVMVPTVREQSGLAMSSRNARLSPEGREVAANLYRALQAVQQALKYGQSAEEAHKEGVARLTRHPEISLEYLEVIDRRDFSTIKGTDIAEQVAVCVAAYVDGVRLIDNVLLNS